ncbi:Coatomer subunit delta [Kappamyces sp. JEL0829]|nr:Coatomer subunit delta [Kappamyces sp. JEL0829]
MPSSRIEGLLTSFPKLISSKDQHTFVETDAVRYVYQPLDQLYIVLITNKNSNILQDIDTLHLFSRIVSEYCKSSDVKEITRQRFELILVFDEVISLGHRENINLGQIKTISAMESNDERIQAEIQKNKEREAKEELKRRAQMMDLKKMEARQNARSSTSSYNKYGGGFDQSSSYNSSSNQGYGNFSSGHSSSAGAYSAPAPSAPLSTPAPLGGRGMQLGKKSNTNSLLETLKAEDGGVRSSVAQQEVLQASAALHETPSPQRFQAPAAASQPFAALDQEAVHINIEEKISATANRDGGIQSMEVNGTMLLKVNDASKAKITVQIGYQPDPSLQFKTHPNVDKTAWASQSSIALRDVNRPFPVSQALGVLKWRYATKDESQLPLLGTCDVTIEFELQHARLALKNVSIIIPFTGQVTQPGTAGTGSCDVDRASSTLVWTIPEISHDEASSGVLEFSMDSDDVSVLYPIQVHFTSEKFVPFEVVSWPGLSASLITDGYQIA